MAIMLHDGQWLFASHGFPAESAPLVMNNSCWSWHELSLRVTFAGARGYIGSLFPITDAEAQEIGAAVFGCYIGIQHWTDRAWTSPHEEVRRNAKRFVTFLIEDLQAWRSSLNVRRRS